MNDEQLNKVFTAITNLETKVDEGFARIEETKADKSDIVRIDSHLERVDSRLDGIDEERAPLVQWAFERYAEGDIAVADLTDQLNTRGLTTAPTRVYPSKPVTLRYIHAMLSNRYCLGITTYCGVEYPGNHERLITQALFD